MRYLWLLLMALCAPLHAAPVEDVERFAPGLRFPEGTVFVGDTLYFVDYGTSTVLRLGADLAAVPAWRSAGCGPNGLLPLGDGTMLVACYDAGTVEQRSLDGRLLRTVDRGAQGEPLIRPNDLAADGHGGAYFTASGGADGIEGRLYHLAAGLTRADMVVDHVRNANGVALSPDGRILYLGESTTDKVLRFDVAADGSLRGRRDFLALDELGHGQTLPGGGRHTPDGVRTDPSGHVFVSLYNGAGFAVFGADGKLLATQSLPGTHHANLAISPDQAWVYGTIDDDEGSLYRVRNPLAPPRG
ncbi:SMP-30/Gluconolactonase/LRE-like region domain-containing protein [Bordetella sputigena]|uniref:SMP-30/gluconolactonase/LRE family protein n=1 Tax=Bordetella sputigena TaxID=1416810 RepID=UPI0039EF41DC